MKLSELGEGSVEQDSCLCVVLWWRFSWSRRIDVSMWAIKTSIKSRNVPGRVKLLVHPGKRHLCLRSPWAR